SRAVGARASRAARPQRASAAHRDGAGGGAVRFRTAVLGGTAALVLGVLAATVGAVAVVLDRSARREIESDLARGRRAFEDLVQDRRALHREEARVIADEPRLKAVVDTQDVTRETVVGVALDLMKAVRSDVFLLAD